ncbi:hypothetical protein ASE03_12620 [Kitasatospora sp. Root187]|nr:MULTISPECIES: hypothetical protein [unclassified Kitasatospora]KQV20900.1 hypothetical protein ASC99_20565 [Kitasatospora sp. Root107]KRB60447.1 hypothetical protein ASE03_12620 [Kitasatospora sp. Root187]
MSDGSDDRSRFTHFHFGHEPEPAEPTPGTLAIPHPGPLSPRGMLIACARCEATRDWLLVHVHPDLVFVRCRCTHEWREPDLEARDVAAARGENFEEREWSSFEEMYRGLGFDGLFHGTYLA